jgi:cation transport ATPase
MAALLYNMIFIPVASGILYPSVSLEPWMAGLAMALSSVSVVSSSLALKWFTAPKAVEQLKLIGRGGSVNSYGTF